MATNNILMQIKNEVNERIKDADNLRNSDSDNFKNAYCCGVKDAMQPLKELIEKYEKAERRKAI